jgi:hypothetical protein
LLTLPKAAAASAIRIAAGENGSSGHFGTLVLKAQWSRWLERLLEFEPSEQKNSPADMLHPNRSHSSGRSAAEEASAKQQATQVPSATVLLAQRRNACGANFNLVRLEPSHALGV